MYTHVQGVGQYTMGPLPGVPRAEATPVLFCLMYRAHVGIVYGLYPPWALAEPPPLPVCGLGYLADGARAHRPRAPHPEQATRVPSWLGRSNDGDDDDDDTTG